MKLITILLFITFFCTQDKKNNQVSKVSVGDTIYRVSQHTDIVNPNLSFTGNINTKEVILNLNVTDNDSVFASLYNYKNKDPYTDLIYLKGSKHNDDFVLRNKDSITLKGSINKSVFSGILTISNTSNQLNLKRNKNYSNGNLIVTNEDNNKKISLLGLRDSEVCQGELTKITSFTKGNFNYHLFYLVHPSAGLYKLRGSCGGGQESLIALIKIDKDVKNTNVDIIDLSSCYNGKESLISEDSYSGDDLKSIWNQDEKLKIKRVNLREDSSEIIVIDPMQDKIVDIRKP